MRIFKNILAVISSTIWISISEFLRNQILLKKYWIGHYKSMGLTFPAEPVNGAVWGLWSLLFAITIFFLSGKFSLLWTFLFSWFIGFVLMWVVIGNLGVLPYGILAYAVPLSMVEAFVAAWITRRIAGFPGN